MAAEVCDVSQAETFICACGPGDWSIGPYVALLRKDCVRCQVQHVTDIDCGCMTDLSGKVATCAKGKFCVLNWVTGNGNTAEKCLDFCTNSDSIPVTAECACKDANGAKTHHATLGSLCKINGDIVHPCTSLDAEPCLCGTATCERGQICSSGICDNATVTCPSGNLFPSTRSTCKCGSNNCIIDS